jgi:hypothetical protein
MEMARKWLFPNSSMARDKQMDFSGAAPEAMLWRVRRSKDKDRDRDGDFPRRRTRKPTQYEEWDLRDDREPETTE